MIDILKAATDTDGGFELYDGEFHNDPDNPGTPKVVVLFPPQARRFYLTVINYSGNALAVDVSSDDQKKIKANDPLMQPRWAGYASVAAGKMFKDVDLAVRAIRFTGGANGDQFAVIVANSPV